MAKRVKFQEMLADLRSSLEAVPEHRTGRNTRYEIVDAGLSAFAVFFLQSPSFLAYQQQMKQYQGKDNAKSLFGIEEIPSDGQIRNLLDPVDPSFLRETFWDIYNGLQAGGHLEDYRHVGGTLLCSLDGTRHFSSEKIHCANCSVYEYEKGTSYAHMVLAAVLSAPGHEHVIALEPEFITPQDGHDKQDCEQQAIKRWVRRNARQFPDWGVTILTDDLHSHQPLCELLLEHKLHFVLTCKPESHLALYEEIGLLTKVKDAVQTMSVRRWTGHHHEQCTYRWVEQVPLRVGADALRVNWCEITIVREDTGKQSYHSAWITSHELSAQTVVDVVAAGRARWKVENETFNVLKNQGYHFEHNYGHGQQYLSVVLLSLLFLAFLFHTTLHLSCTMYQAIRRALGARRNFFNDLRALTRYFYFSGWDEMITFMFQTGYRRARLFHRHS
jgi:hypothetical protein